MRGFALLFLLLTALHSAQRNHHPLLSSAQMGPHEGFSIANFGRQVHRRESGSAPTLEQQFNRFDVGNGGQVGFGLVHGRHLGFKLKLPF